MFQAIHSFVNLEVDPTAMGVDGEVALVDKFLGDVTDFNADILRSIEWCS